MTILAVCLDAPPRPQRSVLGAVVPFRGSVMPTKIFIDRNGWGAVQMVWWYPGVKCSKGCIKTEESCADEPNSMFIWFFSYRLIPIPPWFFSYLYTITENAKPMAHHPIPLLPSPLLPGIAILIILMISIKGIVEKNPHGGS